jgi:hypothetical protein
MLNKKLLFLWQKIIGRPQNGAQGGCHLQGDKKKNANPDDQPDVAAAAEAPESGPRKPKAKTGRDNPEEQQ